MSAIVIVTALEMELAPLVRNWQSRSFSYEGRNFRAHEHGNQVAVAGGIGRAAATLAARAMVARYHPQLLISAGVAGALSRELKAGSLFIPNVVIDSSTATEYPAEPGNEILVTAAKISNIGEKELLRDRFHAAAVDLEAAAVAEVARQEGIGFRCVKAISDEAEFAMPPLDQFVDEEGQFHRAKFALWAALHPSRWTAIAALGRNTGRAAEALCDWLAATALTGFDPHPGEPKLSKS
jgi:adenosylhomocysteine nucleosidase